MSKYQSPKVGVNPGAAKGVGLAIITGSRGQVETSLHRNEIIRARPDDLFLFELDGRNGAEMPNEHLHQDMFQRELGDWLQAIHSGGEPFVSGASATAIIRIIDRCYHIRRPLCISFFHYL